MLFWDDGSRRREVYDLWQRNFQDPVPYADFYFDQYYGRNQVLLHKDEEDEAINGSIHLNPYSVNVRGKRFEGSYIVGVATDEEYRRQGIMRKMLRKTFSSLREKGDPFTYLMPADESYYLPFDFRFGMSQTEQELMCLPAEEKLRFCFRDHLSEEEIQEAVRLEQEEKLEGFAVFTEVDKDYLSRLEKEAASDYGRMLYVFEERQGEEAGDRAGRDYIGRFCVAAEYDTLLINRIFCRRAYREDFLRDIIRYHEDAYHYGNYQIVLDESWDDLVRPAGPVDHVRLLVPHRKKKIMFRILNLEKMAAYLMTAKDQKGPAADLDKSGDNREMEEEDAPGREARRGNLLVRDANLPAQEGCYDICFLEDGRVTVSKRDPGEESRGAAPADWGCIDIGPLTSLLFGDKAVEDLAEEEATGLTETGRSCLGQLIPLRPVCIMEIV